MLHVLIDLMFANNGEDFQLLWLGVVSTLRHGTNTASTHKSLLFLA